MTLLDEPAPARAPRAPRSGSAVTVASVPAGHVYVRHLAPEAGGGPRRLTDPRPAGRPADSQVWWPPAMLDPSWVRGHEFDLLHLHFGFDARSPEDLKAFADALHDTGRPLVYTVHDLRNPHHEDRTLHDAQLDVLVPAADELVTLTAGAAEEIRRRWGRTATVVPHPHVVDLRTMAVAQDVRARRGAGRGDGFRVGLHVKSLRAGMAPMTILPALVDTVASLPGAVLQVDAHRDVLDDDGARRDDRLATYLRGLEADGLVDLRVHDYFTDDELWAYLASLDVSVLPYRFGTHSGWLEACRDLGTTVVAPSCGYYADQGPVLSYVHAEQEYDASTLAEAVRTAFETRPRFGASIDERRGQRAEVAAAHDRVYAAALEKVGRRCASA
ncbi:MULTISPECIES: glycosyltransferase family 1 protein [unclassified Nocardioides]|uniref:glycosyltransferase family 1 protein n=1 Tax=unclassified Nocardioides TaxID=2615069 RepID=UPI002666EE19|nr:glycosyltransferase family 1 protein [Nocardioides sp. Arc9.136]WKN49704.1 glycosyltransferase family 1 protein [Nocardioides sp. Arc9.136]